MPFLTDALTARITVIVVNMWVGIPYTILITSGILMNIPEELYESAKIDGASPVVTFFKITLPCMRPMLIFVLVTTILGGLNMYDVPAMFGGGSANSVLTPMLWLYRQGFSGTYNYNRASATSIILGIIGICLSLVMFHVLRDRDEARLKKIIRRERRESKQKY